MKNYQSNLSTKFNNLKKDYENLQTELSNSKRFTSGNNTSFKSPFQTQASYVPTNQNKEYKTSSQVLQEFRDIINRTSQITNMAQSRNQSMIVQSQCQNQMMYQNKKEKLLQEKDKIINVNLNDSDSSDSLNIDKLNISHASRLNEDDIINIDGINPHIHPHSQRQGQAPSQPTELDKLKLSNQILTRSNIDLRNSNKILELELTSYQSNPLYSKESITSQYDDNLLKFIQNLKASLLEAIQSNLQLQDVISTFQSSTEALNTDNISLRKSYMAMRNEIDGTLRKNAEIQIANEDNSMLLTNLEANHQKLQSDLISIQNLLEEMKNEEMNMHLLHDSNIKRKKDNDNLVMQLKVTIENLTKGNEASWKRKENSEIAIEDSSRSVNERMMVLQELNEEVMKKERENEEIEKEIEMKKMLLEEKDGVIIEINGKYDEVKGKMNGILDDNEKLRYVIGEKEAMIEEIKGRIEEITQKINGDVDKKIIDENCDEDLEEMIMMERKKNENKEREIQEITMTYEQIVLKKDEMIEMYEEMYMEKNNKSNVQGKENIYIKEEEDDDRPELVDEILEKHH